MGTSERRLPSTASTTRKICTSLVQNIWGIVIRVAVSCQIHVETVEGPEEKLRNDNDEEKDWDDRKGIIMCRQMRYGDVF